MAYCGDKEQIARVEKYAQSHLDRAHAVSTSATRTALLWLVALAIIWFQQLEPKLAQVRQAQLSRRAIAPASTLGLQSIGVTQRFQRDESLAKQEELELPFSIKFKLPPELVTTLWLTLALGLSVYLLVSRRRVLRLCARGLRLLQTEVNAEPTYVRSVVGEAVWWLTPLPIKNGRVLTSHQFRRALGRGTHPQWPAVCVVLLCASLLLLVETRVFYVGFCVASFLTQQAWWLVASAINCGLFLGCLLAVWKWFSPMDVPDLLDGEHIADRGRRRVLTALSKDAVLTIAGMLWIGGSTYAFARVNRKSPLLKDEQPKRRSRRRKNNRTVAAPKVKDGLYKNSKTGTVHTATAACKKCLAGVNLAVLKEVSVQEVDWNARPLPRSLPLFPRFDGSNPQPHYQTSNSRMVQPARSSSTPPSNTLHPHSAHRIFLIEQAALSVLEQNNKDQAVKILMDAILATRFFGIKESIRLYDLLAGILVRSGDRQRLAILVQTARDEIGRILAIEEQAAPTAGPVLALLYKLSNNEPAPETGIYQRHHEAEKQKHPTSKGQNATTKKTLKARRNHNEYIKAVMNDRIQKWQDSTGAWCRYWQNKSKPVRWGEKYIS